jgi:hypothetical protein
VSDMSGEASLSAPRGHGLAHLHSVIRGGCMHDQLFQNSHA